MGTILGLPGIGDGELIGTDAKIPCDFLIRALTSCIY